MTSRDSRKVNDTSWGKLIIKTEDQLSGQVFCLVEISSEVKFMYKNQGFLESSAFLEVLKLCLEDWAEEVRNR